MEIPTDPFILLSYINTQLRDNYENLDELCRSLDIDRHNLEAKLESAGFSYMPTINQFR